MNSDPRREEDGILLQCYRETGDERAFEELVHRHLDLVYGTAFRDLRSAADAEDVSQRVFISLARAGRSEPIRNLPAWLFTCSRREVQSMIRKESRRRIRESKVAEWAGLDNDSQSQSPLVDEEGPKPILREAMNRLPESDQEALFLRFHQNMSFAEIGSTLGIRQRAAQKRVYRAIERLRNDLKRRGAPVSAAVFSPSLFTAGMLKAPEGLAGPLAKTALSKSVTTSGWTASALLTLTKTSILLLGGAGLLVVSSPGLNPFGRGSNPAGEPTANEGNRPAASFSTLTGVFGERGLQIDDLEGIYSLPESDREKALARLRTYLETVSDRDYLRNLFRRWTKLDHERCTSDIYSLMALCDPEDRGRSELLQELLGGPMNHWARTDGNRLFNWLKRLPRTEAESLTLEIGLTVLGASDPSAGFSLLADRPVTGDRLFDTLATAISSRWSFKKACSWLAELPDPGIPETFSENGTSPLVGGSLRPRERMINAVLPWLLRQDPQAVADWISTLPASEEGNAYTGTFVRLWASLEPDKAAVWVRDLEFGAQVAVLPVLINSWAADQPEQAVQWLVDNDLPVDRWALVGTVIQLWVENGGAKEPGEWLERYQNEVAAAPIFADFSDAIPLDEAIEWVDDLLNDEARWKALPHVFFREARDHPEAAKQKVRKVEEPEPVGAMTIRAVAEGLFVGGGRRSLETWRHQLEQEGASAAARVAFETEVDLLAAIDPSKAAKLVMAQPVNGDRDQLVEILLARAASRSLSDLKKARDWAGHLVDHHRRTTWERRFQKIERSKPWEKALLVPEAVKTEFGNQTRLQFRRTVDLLARQPTA